MLEAQAFLRLLAFLGPAQQSYCDNDGHEIWALALAVLAPALFGGCAEVAQARRHAWWLRRGAIPHVATSAAAFSVVPSGSRCATVLGRRLRDLGDFENATRCLFSDGMRSTGPSRCAPDVLLVCAHGVCRLVLPSRPRGERVTSPWRDLERGRTGLPGDRGTDGWNTHTLRGFLIRLCPKSWTNRIVRSNNAGSHQGVRWTGATPVFGTDHRSDLNAACAFFAHLSRRLADTGFGRPSSRGPNR